VRWLVDGIDLTAICQAARWQWRGVVQGLELAGLTHADALVFGAWAFGDDVRYQRAVSDESLTAEQFARLRVAASDPPMHSAGPPL
jgi:hypothetical protein